MRLVDITIANFRGIRSLQLPLSQLTVLIGENNSGKSTILEAIRLVLGRGAGLRRNSLSEYDFHLPDASATPQTAQPIALTLHFAEEQADEWPEDIAQQLVDIIQTDSQGRNHIWLRVAGTYNPKISNFELRPTFVNAEGIELPSKTPNLLNTILRLVPMFFLSALRDASQEFGLRGQFWSSFLKSIQIPDDQRQGIEEQLRAINASVIGANAGLSEVIRRIAETNQLVPLADAEPVTLEALPTRVFDMTGKLQVLLTAPHGAKLPLQRYGEGTQSLAVLMLFRAFVTANLAEAYTPESTPLLALEEPEAHLHPSAARALGTLLAELPGQILVSSHSGDLVSRVPLFALRRLYKVSGETKVGFVPEGTFDQRELQAIDYSIRQTRGQFLFSRCWLLVEGETEFHLLPMLFDLMEYPQDQINISILEISQAYNKGEPFIKLAKALGIQWFLLADGDDAGNDYIARARRQLEPDETVSDRMVQLSHRDIEHEFWHNGYDTFMKGLVPAPTIAEISTITDNNEQIKRYIKAAIKAAGGKPAFAQTLIAEIKQRGKATIPLTLQQVIERVAVLTRS